MSSLDAFLNHPIETLEKALQIRKQIDHLNELLKELFGPSPISLAGIQTNAPQKRGRPRKVPALTETGAEKGTGLNISGRKKKRKMSAAAKAKIAAAQRARWAKQKGTAGLTTPVAKPASAAKKGKQRNVSKKKGASRKARLQMAEAGQPKFKIL